MLLTFPVADSSPSFDVFDNNYHNNYNNNNSSSNDNNTFSDSDMGTDDYNSGDADATSTAATIITTDQHLHQQQQQQQQQQQHLQQDKNCSSNNEGAPPKKKRIRKTRAKVKSPELIQKLKTTRRQRANDRERNRMHGLNEALEVLRTTLPNSTEAKMTKIETLRYACNYINALASSLRLIDQNKDRTGLPCSGELPNPEDYAFMFNYQYSNANPDDPMGCLSLSQGLNNTPPPHNPLSSPSSMLLSSLAKGSQHQRENSCFSQLNQLSLQHHHHHRNQQQHQQQQQQHQQQFQHQIQQQQQQQRFVFGNSVGFESELCHDDNDAEETFLFQDISNIFTTSVPNNMNSTTSSPHPHHPQNTASPMQLHQQHSTPLQQQQQHPQHQHQRPPSSSSLSLSPSACLTGNQKNSNSSNNNVNNNSNNKSSSRQTDPAFDILQTFTGSCASFFDNGHSPTFPSSSNHNHNHNTSSISIISSSSSLSGSSVCSSPPTSPLDHHDRINVNVNNNVFPPTPNSSRHPSTSSTPPVIDNMSFLRQKQQQQQQQQQHDSLPHPQQQQQQQHQVVPSLGMDEQFPRHTNTPSNHFFNQLTNPSIRTAKFL